MKFKGIWFNLDKEVKVDVVDAANSTEASNKIHKLYAGTSEPAPCLTIVPYDEKYFASNLFEMGGLYQ